MSLARYVIGGLIAMVSFCWFFVALRLIQEPSIQALLGLAIIVFTIPGAVLGFIIAFDHD